LIRSGIPVYTHIPVYDQKVTRFLATFLKQQTKMESAAKETAGPAALGPKAKFFPLDRVRLGLWESRLHLDGQLFAMVQKDKFVFVAVHPVRELSSPTHNQKLFIENLNMSELTW